MKQKIILLGALLTTVTAMTKAQSTSWTVSERVRLTSKLLMAREEKFEDDKSISVYFDRLPMFFETKDTAKRRQDSDNEAKFIVSYALGDSAKYFSRIKLFNCSETDTLEFEYSCQDESLKKFAATPTTPHERQQIMGNILPLASLVMNNPGQKLKKSVMGFSFPDQQSDGTKLITLQMEKYAIRVASVLYDYVLQRRNDIITVFVVQYSSDYTDLTKPATYQTAFPMDKFLFKDIKQSNFFPLNFE